MMLAAETDAIRVRLPEGELADFLAGAGPPVPSAGDILTAIDAEVAERCDSCLPAAAHALSFLSYWVGIGRLTPERAAAVVNEQNICLHLGLVAVAA
jgi:hypothetical protein